MMQVLSVEVDLIEKDVYFNGTPQTLHMYFYSRHCTDNVLVQAYDTDTEHVSVLLEYYLQLNSQVIMSYSCEVLFPF